MDSTVGPAVMSPMVHTARHIDANQAQYHPWTIPATVSGWIATLSVLVLALVYIVCRRMEHGNYQRMNEPSSMGLSEIMRKDHSREQVAQSSMATGKEQDEIGTRREDKTKGQEENTWNSACQHCQENISNRNSSDETRRKTVYTTESDTARLHDLL